MGLLSAPLQVAISTFGTVVPFTVTDSRIVSRVEIPSAHVHVAVNGFWNDGAQFGSCGVIPIAGLPTAGKSIVTCRSPLLRFPAVNENFLTAIVVLL
jgi:hypothetical protein